jgi:ATP-dependent Zn protease
LSKRVSSSQEIAEEKSGLIQEAFQKVLLKLNNSRDSLEKLTRILLEKEPIEGDELKKFAEEVRNRAIPPGEAVVAEASH